MPPRTDVPFRHLTADFLGALPSQLGDASLISGLMIASAGAAGLAAMGVPSIRIMPDGGVRALLLLDDCHMSVHTFPARELLMLDVLTLSTHDARKALDIFTRRMTARQIRSEVRDRG